MIAPIIFASFALAVGAYLVARRSTYLAGLLYVIILLCPIVTFVAALGHPVSLRVARHFLPERVQLAGYILHEGVSIDLLIANPEMLVSMPWDEKKAAQLYQADQQARAGQTALMMDLDALAGKPGQGKAGQGKPGKGNPAGTQGTKDNEPPIFYPAPVAALPDKQGD